MVSLEQLFLAADKGQLDKYIIQLKTTECAALAAGARSAFSDAVDKRLGQRAFLAALTAARLYGRLGNSEEQFRNLVDGLQIEFMVADNIAAYERVRDRAKGLMIQAQAAHVREYQFQCSVMAADSAFFALELAKGPDEYAWLVKLLNDLNIACDLAIGFEKTDFIAKLASLLAASVDLPMTRYFGDREKQELDGLLKILAPKADKAIPADFVFPGEPEKTARISDVLAQLADRYGN